jgi:hypothetical protein
MMINPTAAKRLTVLKGAAVAGVLATTGLAAATADAQVFVINNGTNTALNTSQLISDIGTANTNGGTNTILLGAGAYAPSTALPTITDPQLTISGLHTVQGANGGGVVFTGGGFTTDTPTITVAPAGGLTLEGMSLRAMGVLNGAFPAIDDQGTLNGYDVSIEANNAEATMLVEPGASSTLTASSVFANQGVGVDNEGGTVQLNNDTFAQELNTNAVLDNSGTTNATNSIFTQNGTNNGLTSCAVPLNASDHSVDTDASCTAAGDTTSTQAAQTLGQLRSNGGPAVTASIPSTTGSTNTALGLGNPLTCTHADGRFFSHTSAGCDAGDYQHDGTLVTTGPSCPGPGVITQNGGGQNVSQAITVADPAGFGPEGGLVTDLSDAQASVTIGNDQLDAIDGVVIDNGTVAASGIPTAATIDTGSPLTVTATKSTIGTATHWQFTATDWAGLTTLCK